MNYSFCQDTEKQKTTSILEGDNYNDHVRPVLLNNYYLIKYVCLLTFC